MRESYQRGASSSTAWRRERLLNIGNNPARSPPSDESSFSETVALSASTPDLASYGSVPTPRNPKGRRFRKTLPSLPAILTSPRSRLSSPISTRRHQSLFARSRSKTLSTYDPPPSAYGSGGNDYFESSGYLDTKLNGVRVWYSSFTSVDWLHDAIKVSGS